MNQTPPPPGKILYLDISIFLLSKEPFIYTCIYIFNTLISNEHNLVLIMYIQQLCIYSACCKKKKHTPVFHFLADILQCLFSVHLSVSLHYMSWGSMDVKIPEIFLLFMLGSILRGIFQQNGFIWKSDIFWGSKDLAGHLSLFTPLSTTAK